MRRLFTSSALGCAYLVAGAFGAAGASPVPASAQQPPQAALPASLPTPTPIRAGSLTAYKYGSGPKTLILIPGLACDPSVWDATVAALQPKYTIYTVWLDGFAGAPPAKAPYVDGYARSLEQLITAQKIDKPILVGHSLGGTVALRAAIDEPAALSGVVAVDSLPLFPPLGPGETIAARQANGPKLAGYLTGMSDAAYAENSAKVISAEVTDPAQAQALNARALKSDRATVAGAFTDLATTDLSPALPKISVPVLVLAAAAAYGPDATKQFYAAQYKGAPNLTVVPVADARHFIMLDQPAAFRAALTSFVDALK